MTLAMLPLVFPGTAQGWGFAALAAVVGAVLAGIPLLLHLRNLAGQKKLLETKVTGLTQDLDRSNQTLHGALAAIENENFTDPLTELRNRRYLSAIIKSDVAKVQRVYRDTASLEQLANQDLLFLMVDLDHFSRINDYYSQAVGDQVLVAVAQALKRVFRETDAVIRWGGEEFLVVTKNTTRAEAPELAERIRTAIAGLSVETTKGEVLRWTCCVGVAAFPFQIKDFNWLGWERVVEIATTCVEVAKLSGRNAWVGVLAKDGLDRVKHGSRIPKDLKHLVDEGVLEVLASRDDPFGKTKKVGEILG
jgi:diguanylate cyclase (GGDEF)-like protein